MIAASVSENIHSITKSLLLFLSVNQKEKVSQFIFEIEKKPPLFCHLYEFKSCFFEGQR